MSSLKRYNEEEFDFGTTAREGFLDYINRIEGEIDRYIKGKRMSPLLVDVIVTIFNDVMVNTPKKMHEFVQLIEPKIGREATFDDLSMLTDYFRKRIEDKINRKQLSDVFTARTLDNPQSPNRAILD